MTFTIEERRLVVLYYAGSADDTALIIRDALPYITEPDVRAAAVSSIAKLESMSGKAIDGLPPESEDYI